MRYDILILGPNPYNKNINHAGGQLTATTNLIKYIEHNQLSYKIVDTFRSSFPSPSIKDKLKSSWKMYKELKSMLTEHEFAGAIVFVAYGFGYWEKILFSLLIEKRGVKTLFFIRSGHFMQSVIDKNYQVFIKRFFMNKLSYIGYQGGKWGEFYKKMGIKEQKLIKILNWIDIKAYQKSFNNEKITFLYVGWMVQEKGIVELIDTILEHQDLERYEFIFIGGGTLLDELNQKVKSIGAENISFKGWLESSSVSHYYEKVDCLILPSHAEGFPNVILESLNHRLPIIATNVGGISESVVDGYNGFLIEPKDKIGLYKSIKKMGESSELRENFSKNSEDILKKNHAIDVNCSKIFKLFEN